MISLTNPVYVQHSIMEITHCIQCTLKDCSRQSACFTLKGLLFEKDRLLVGNFEKNP